MRYLALFNCLLLTFRAKQGNCESVEFDFEGRIVGGEDTFPGEFQFFTRWRGCGASLIHSDIVLTAAHCSLVGSNDVIVGAHKKVWEPEPSPVNSVKREITERRVHPYFSVSTLRYDFMVMKLNETVSLPPIKINSDSSIPLDNSEMTIAGFGSREPRIEVTPKNASDPSAGWNTRNPFENFNESDFFDDDDELQLRSEEVLQKVNIPKISFTACNNKYGGFIHDPTMICAGETEGGKDACFGDSGGPLFSTIAGDLTQFGVISFGSGCARPGTPGVYSRVSVVYEWIQEQICELSSSKPQECPGIANLASPTELPTKAPTKTPSTSPTVPPTSAPSQSPTNLPTQEPTKEPTRIPTKQPSVAPTSPPTLRPSPSPTNSPTQEPSKQPSAPPTSSPTPGPSVSPTGRPTLGPTKAPTNIPTQVPTKNPSVAPTFAPTANPSESPTTKPTQVPTLAPTNRPTQMPTNQPSLLPTAPPTQDTSTAPIDKPTSSPSVTPTNQATSAPSGFPSNRPTDSVTSTDPSTAPSIPPSTFPSTYPSVEPSVNVSSEMPSTAPSVGPSQAPSLSPSAIPSSLPSSVPSSSPSKSPSQRPQTDDLEPSDSDLEAIIDELISDGAFDLDSIGVDTTTSIPATQPTVAPVPMTDPGTDIEAIIDEIINDGELFDSAFFEEKILKFLETTIDEDP